MVWRTVAAAAALAVLQQAQAFQVTLKNQCTGSMVLFDASSTETIAEGSSTTRTISPNSGAHVFRYGTGAQATRTFLLRYIYPSAICAHLIDPVVWCSG